jgi:hypothetical protein
MVHAPGNGVKYKRITGAGDRRASESIIENVLAILTRCPALKLARIHFPKNKDNEYLV